MTATLRHRGSDAAMLCFQGGPQQHHWTREDAEHGETLTIAVTLRRAAIDAMAGRYWMLDGANTDPSSPNIYYSLFWTIPLRMPPDRQRLRDEIDAFVATTPTASVGQPRPTRALNRAMPQAVARSRRQGVPADVELVVRAIAKEEGTFAAEILTRHG